MSIFDKLFGRKKEEAPEPKASANGWICQTCGKENSNSHQDCPKCGEPRYQNG